VFLSRFTAFLRAVMPGMAGASQMPYRRFLLFNALGGITWGLGFTMLGYLAGASYQKLESYAGKVSQAILVVVILGVAILMVRRHRSRSSLLESARLTSAHETTSPDSVAQPRPEG
jgi:membrane protein DedA with SNARE-associated domain